MARKKTRLSDEDVQEKKRKFEQIAGNLEIIPADKFLKDNFLPYAWSYNLDRALVDVTGLKPVQRRILFTMFKDGLKPTANRSKVATLAGRVLAYHPHGNASVEDALKNMARSHIFRIPLIDGKGDFGAPGTPGAAARYIEARLNRAAWLNVEEIEEHAVRMVPNYDGHLTEPIKIPVRWPVAVINGSAGIAIAYASNMPSHNPTEVMKACKALLKNPDTTHRALAKIILGPDFNTGGIITSNDGIKEYLETGSGSFKIRGNYEVTQRPRGASRIEFYEIPYGTHQEKIIQQLQAAIEKKRFTEVASFKDLSDLKHPIRIIIDTKPGTNYKKVLQDLFSYTDLESSFAANITTIVDNKPQRSSMKELLLDFIEFRKSCVRNKLSYSLNKKNDRLHLVEGLLKALLDIDAAIEIIRKSEDAAEASKKLQAKFKLDERQAEYVLSLQLKRLTRMDKVELDNEKAGLEDEIAYYTKVLNEEEALREYLLKEFDETLKVIGDERKTEIMELSTEEFLESEKSAARELKAADKNVPVYVTRFANGTVLKAENPFLYSPGEKKFFNSPIVEQVKMKSQDLIVLVGSDGIGRRVPLSYLTIGLPLKADKIGVSLPRGVKLVGICKAEAMKSDVGLALATKQGVIKIAKTDFPKGDEFPVILLDEGDSVVDCRWLGKTLTNTWFALSSKAGNMLVFPAPTVRVAGSKAGGVKGIKLKDAKDELVGFSWVQSNRDPDTMVLSKANNSFKLTPIGEIPTKNKGGMGVVLHGFGKGETELTDVYVGTKLAVALEGVLDSIPLPMASKRAARGAEFRPKVLFGSTEVTPL